MARESGSLNMDLLSLLTRIFRRLTAIFLQTTNPTVTFTGRPYVSGCLPKLICDGKIDIGRQCEFRTLRIRQNISALKGGHLSIGDNALINDGVNICASIRIEIGNNAKIGDMTFIYDTDFHEVSPTDGVRQAPVYIGKNVWIGTGCKILAGARIGDHAVIAAGAVVTGEIPPRSVAAGVPARVISSFAAPDGWIRR